ncbi:hypothetical protein AC579_5306 [Pseudocercospora musae]|uniref:Heterokaryon incompatibility domain-containing protein n=1 Tax=Pseudocercospora musae TaxID=113226 RepID=A0A139H6J6_9PEZI|nr:hypothetical protein AC579_5306 [Pseudocercospora musae]
MPPSAALIDAELCSVCSSTLKDACHTSGIEDSSTWEAILDASDQGCPICGWLLDKVRINEGAFSAITTLQSAHSTAEIPILRSWHGYGHVFSGRYSDGFQGEVNSDIDTMEMKCVLLLPLASTRPHSFRWSDIQVSVDLYLEPALTAMAQAYYPPEDMAADKTFGLFKSWLDDCLDLHAGCRPGPRKDWCPTRLIQVALDGGYSRSVNYVALSHRWLAADEEIELRKHNMNSYRVSVPIQKLKLSIQQAFMATLRLGYHYIWVDTLCITQDDDDDRTKEMLDMHNIYTQSVCTIAAAAGDSDEAGCFTKRQVSPLSNFRVALDLSSHVPGAPLYHRMRHDWNEGVKEIKECNLSQRGWIFQERFLSRRTLHYCKAQMHWECQQNAATETYPEGRPTRRLYDNAAFKPSSNTGGDAQILPPWQTAVTEYTGRSMTISGDRLNGLAGVAAFYACRYEDHYLFGHWARHLPIGLLWDTHGSSKSPQKSKKRLRHLAPSWSWASISCSVEFWMAEEDGTDWSDRLSSAIRDSTRTLADIVSLPANIGIDARYEGSNTKDKANMLRIRGQPRTQRWSSTHETRTHDVDGRIRRYNRTPIITLDVDPPLQEGDEVTYLPVASWMSGNGSLIGHCGLALQLVRDDAVPVYSRLGQYWQEDASGFEEDAFRDVDLC